MSNQEFDLALLINRPKLDERCLQIAQEFKYTADCSSSIDEFLDKPCSASFIVAAMNDAERAISAAEIAQVVRSHAPSPYLACVISKTMPKEEAAFAKKSGANLLLVEEEILHTGKLEFVITQILRTKFLPVKASDLVPEVVLTFDLFHLMPQRSKFLKIARSGEPLEKVRYEKLLGVGELYLDRSSASAFSRYVTETTDLSSAGLRKRCRSKFLALFEGFSRLVFQLTDQSEHASFGEGQELLKQCRALCADLLGTLGEFGNAWEVINNSAIGDLGSVERAPTMASYAGIFGLLLGIDEVEDVMLAALLTDLGLLGLSPSSLRKIREDHLEAFTAEEEEAYRHYPEKSLALVLEQKLSLSDALKSAITCSNERADGTGFPKGFTHEKIPRKAQLVHFCREFDRRTLLRMGQARVQPLELLKKLLEEEAELSKIYDLTWTRKLREALG